MRDLTLLIVMLPLFPVMLAFRVVTTTLWILSLRGIGSLQTRIDKSLDKPAGGAAMF